MRITVIGRLAVAAAVIVAAFLVAHLSTRNSQDPSANRT